MDKFEESQLVLKNTCYNGWFTYHIVVIIYSYDEIEGRISTVYDFVLPVIQKTTLIFRATQTFPYEFTLESHSLPDAERIEVFRQTGLTLLVNHEHELYHIATLKHRWSTSIKSLT